jgi:hypothetical protein
MHGTKLSVLLVVCFWAVFSAGEVFPVLSMAGENPSPPEPNAAGTSGAGEGINPGILQLLLREDGSGPPPPPVCTAIPNGDFESGNTLWTEYSTHGWDLITNSFLGVTPHNGLYAVWLGGDADDVSYIEQQVAISSSCPLLTWYHWIASDDLCGYDYGYIRINGTSVGTYQLCETNDTGGWLVQSVDLSVYAGQTITLQIRAETDNINNSNWFIDDVSLTPTP